MERAPPQDGIMDDRQIDGPYEPINRRYPPFPAALAFGRSKSDVTQVEKEKHEHRCQASVPFPPGTPGRTSPNRSRGKTNERKSCARGPSCPPRDSRQRVTPYQLAN